MQKRIFAIGGGELKGKTTLKIDEVIARRAKERAGEKRAYGLFLGTASHDSLPYFNSFRKIYTSVFDIKADVALTVYGEMNFAHVAEKFEKADLVYVGGGDTLFMLQNWREKGILPLLSAAYERGVVFAGVSAGAICWFSDMYTDSDILRGGTEYKFEKGLGWLDGLMTPHYGERRADFSENFAKSPFSSAYAVEDNAALEFIDGKFSQKLGDGAAFLVKKTGGGIAEEAL